MNSTPWGYMTMDGPDEDGFVMPKIYYEFPFTRDGDASVQSARWWLREPDGDDWVADQAVYYLDDEHDFRTLSPLLFACRASGTYAFTLSLRGCSWYDTDGAFNFQPRPEASVGIVNTGGTARRAEMYYKFPYTPNYALDNVTRSYRLLIRDSTGVVRIERNYVSLGQREGTLQESFDTACWPEGSATASVEAYGCGSETGRGSMSFAIDDGVSVDVSMYEDAAAGEVKATVNWSFATAPGRVKLVQIEPNGAGAVLADFTPTTLSGSNTYSVNAGGELRTVRVEATAYGNSCAYAYDIASHTCGCDRSVGDPVDVVSGNVRYDDRDPLPSPGGGALSRAYDSRHSVSGRFGVGWTSMFDSVVRPNLPASVMVITDANALVVFQAEGVATGSFEQRWPRNSTKGILVFGSGTYGYRPAGTSRVWIYNAATGRLQEVRDEEANRSMYFTYDGAGNPSAVIDSWGAWSWTVATDASGRIASIRVDEDPTILWRYSYDPQGHLTDVYGPESLPWRHYEYADGRLTEVYDGIGNLIESHTYDDLGRAITSHGPTDETTSIDYAASGTTSTQWITRVTRAVGAVMEYRLRLVGGTWRPTEVLGSCLSCGSGADVTNVYDPSGLITRTQNAAGYVTIASTTKKTGWCPPLQI